MLLSTHMLDIITIGESLRDVFYMIHDATVSCSIHKDRCLLCLEYAEKIPVDSVVKIPAAGNSANAAVSASRLGLKTALVSWVGKDFAGDQIREALKKEKVHEKFIIIDAKKPTSESTVINFQGERTQLVYFQPRSYILPTLPACRAIYYSAMGIDHARMDLQLLTHLKKNPNILFAFQPGTTHIRAGLDANKKLIARSDFFILNKEEAHHLLSDGDRTMLNMLEAFHHIGAKQIIITDGPNGADAFDGTTHFHMPIFPGKVIERTGAGDAFASSVISATLQKKKLAEALRYGSANSASVVGQVGPQAGLVHLNEMKRILKKNMKVCAHIV